LRRSRESCPVPQAAPQQGEGRSVFRSLAWLHRPSLRAPNAPRNVRVGEYTVRMWPDVPQKAAARYWAEWNALALGRRGSGDRLIGRCIVGMGSRMKWAHVEDDNRE